MEIRSYLPFEGDTVYDLAARLYSDTALGVDDIVLLNPGINLLDAHAFGEITYTFGKTRTIQRILVPVQVEEPQWSVYYGQSQYDLAIQLYGSMEGIGKILRNLPPLNEDVPVGMQIPYPFEQTRDSLFFDRNIVATWIQSGADFETFLRLLEDGSYRLLEGTGRRRLE